MPMYKALGKCLDASSILILSLLMLLSINSWAAGNTILETQGSNNLNLVVAKSIIIKSEQQVKRVSIAAPEIADFVLLSPNELYLTGKAAGTTNLTLWHYNDMRSIYDLEVSYDVGGLKQKLHSLLPDEKEISAIGVHDTITLTGTVSSTANLSTVTALAEAYASKEKIVNLLQVKGIHQVMLEVRVAEMSKTVMKRLGVNFSWVKGSEFAVNLLGNLGTFGVTGPGFTGFSESVKAAFRFNSGNNQWTFLIDALQENGLVKILAEPTLIALSGETATFLAGGEFPVPEAGGLGTTNVEYKSFGVQLSFTPMVLSEDKISINVTPEVSNLDLSTALLVEGFVTPGLRTRRASTMVQLADGQSFAIAGLLSENIRQNVSKFPFLGDIPILGALFRSTDFQKEESELIIIVTPHLVKPLDLAKQTLPTDYYIEPNDLEFYLLGAMEGKERVTKADLTTALDGEFGYGIRMSK